MMRYLNALSKDLFISVYINRFEIFHNENSVYYIFSRKHLYIVSDNHLFFQEIVKILNILTSI